MHLQMLPIRASAIFPQLWALKLSHLQAWNCSVPSASESLGCWHFAISSWVLSFSCTSPRWHLSRILTLRCMLGPGLTQGVLSLWTGSCSGEWLLFWISLLGSLVDVSNNVLDFPLHYFASWNCALPWNLRADFLDVKTESVWNQEHHTPSVCSFANLAHLWSRPAICFCLFPPSPFKEPGVHSRYLADWEFKHATFHLKVFLTCHMHNSKWMNNMACNDIVKNTILEFLWLYYF